MTSTSTTQRQNIKIDCMICADEVSQRKMIKCPFCEFQACNSCTERFLMSIDDYKPRCMDNGCKKVWNCEFLSSNFSYGFYNKKYRNRRAILLHEKEKSLLPGTQQMAKDVLKDKMEKKYKKSVKGENKMLKQLIIDEFESGDIDTKLVINIKSSIKSNLQKLKNINKKKSEKKEKSEKKLFTRACPVNECRGFLSTSLKCGTCSTFACKHCHLPKKCKIDDDHECDPELVATVKMLANDTKPCPACATPIHKINGCDQIWCTICHTAFSWKRGVIERGVIHNPHYYAFQREQNNGNAPRNHMDMVCGGVPSIHSIITKLVRSGEKFDYIDNAHRLINHINTVELYRYPNITEEAVDNSNLRVKYLNNNIDEKKWISKLKKQTKRIEKNNEFHHVLRMLSTTMSDIMGNIEKCANHEVILFLTSIIDLREYANKSLRKIGICYGNIYPYISTKFDFCDNAQKKNENIL